MKNRIHMACRNSLFLLLSLLFLSACGGGGNTAPPLTPIPAPVVSTPTPPPTETPTNNWEQGVFEPAEEFASQCDSPRNGVDINGIAYPDIQGNMLDEKLWLRSWSNETYLWYDEIEDIDPEDFATPQQYFHVLKTNETTISGAPKDNFHFTLPTEEFESFAQSGVEVGYGVDWAIINPIVPREIIVQSVEPNSSAEFAGIKRGDKLIEINATDIITTSNVNLLDQAIFPISTGTSYDFTFQRAEEESFTVTLASQEITRTFVNNVNVLDSDAGRVGYMRFDSFQRPAQQALIDAFQVFQDEGATDLILDLRYNQGGLIAMASQLAYMIAGPSQTNDRVFESLRYNDKSPFTDPQTGESTRFFPFIDKEIDWEQGVNTDNDLPSLNLTKVYIITTERTCSASEALINSLRGIDIEVVQIGGKTCGKPYGYVPTDNCGTTYFTIQFQGVNDKGFGDYVKGFKPKSSPVFDDELPGCSVSDDLRKSLGNIEEGMLAASLTHLTTGDCPAETANKPFSAASSSQTDSAKSEIPGSTFRTLQQRDFLKALRVYTMADTKE